MERTRIRTRFTRSCIATTTTAALALIATSSLATSCGGDDDEGGAAGSGGSGSGGSGGGGGSSGSGGSGGNVAVSGSGGGGSGGNGGTGGAQDAGGAGEDAGQDSGTPEPMGCRAPVPATNPGNECPAGDEDPVPLTATLVKDGLDVPVFVTHAPGDDSRLFVVERGGRIVIIDPETGDEISDFLMLTDPFAYGGGTAEYGLLGMAFHPNYPEDPRFFVNYTAQPMSQLMTVVSSFEVSASDPDVADPESEQVLIDFDQPEYNHNGGMLAFGADDCLYIATGDGGGGGDPFGPIGNGQNLNTELGKILRMDVDNPEEGAPGNLEGAGVPHIWDYGLRNPWRFSFDRETHDLYIGDVGQGAWEEIDVEPAGTGHRNYGWRMAEGNHCYTPANCDMDGLEPAVDEYPHGDNDDCVVGGYVYRGSAISSLQGWYIYADNGASRRIRAFVWDGEGRCNDRTVVLGELGGSDALDLDADITSFGEDANGELYITTMTSVYRIDAD